MMDLDKELKNLKEDNLKAPKEFEAVMREALEKFNREDKKKNKFNNKYLKIALLFISFIFILNISTVSAMVKKLIGYNEYFSYYSYVKKLNEIGKIQDVDEKIVFSNGKEVTIEAMVYDNKYIAVFMKEKVQEEYNKAKVEAVGGEATGVIGVGPEREDTGDYLRVERFKIGEDKEKVNLIITEKEESKEITINIDTSKKIHIENIKPEENEIEIDGVKFILNNLRVSPLSLDLDYSLVSEDDEKIKANQINKGSFFNEGIYFMPNIEGRNIEPMGVSGAYDEVEVLDNGIRFIENFVVKDLAVDKFNKANIVIERANFTEALNLDMKSNVKNKKINDNLFIEELEYNEETETVYIAYWSKCKKIWWDKYLTYEIIPYDGLISYEPSTHKSNTKDYLGKDYRKYEFMRRQLYIGEGKEFFIANNKALDIRKKDRTIKVKIDY